MKIRSFALSILMVLLFSGMGFAQVDIEGPETHGALSPITGANIQQGQSLINTFNPTNIVETELTFRPTNIDVQGQQQGQKQKQGQAQGQFQGQLNDWTQTFEAPRDLLPAPYVQPSQIQILPGKMRRMADNEVPNVGIKPYNGEEYIAVESFNGSIFNRIRQEDLAEDLLTFKSRVLSKEGWLPKNVRLVVYVRDAGESTTTSGGGSAAASMNPSVASGAASTLGLFPGKARWKQDDQYNPVFYLVKEKKVSSAVPVILYEKKPEVKAAPKAETKPVPASTEPKGWFKF